MPVKRNIDEIQEPLKALLDEALPSVASSAQIFANAPATTKLIMLTIRVATVTMTFDGSTATTSNGHDWAVNSTSSPYVFQMTKSEALLVQAIQSGGTATGHITYFG